ncbi:hypothetical protein SPURM210S_03305 [Streptomyces purpurascens]
MPGSAESSSSNRLLEAGHDVLGVAAHAPHYIARSPVPGRGRRSWRPSRRRPDRRGPVSPTPCALMPTAPRRRSTGRSARATTTSPPWWRAWRTTATPSPVPKPAAHVREPVGIPSADEIGKEFESWRSERATPDRKRSVRSPGYSKVGLTGGIGAWGKSEVSRPAVAAGAGRRSTRTASCGEVVAPESRASVLVRPSASRRSHPTAALTAPSWAPSSSPTRRDSPPSNSIVHPRWAPAPASWRSCCRGRGRSSTTSRSYAEMASHRCTPPRHRRRRGPRDPTLPARTAARHDRGGHARRDGRRRRCASSAGRSRMLSSTTTSRWRNWSAV